MANTRDYQLPNIEHATVTLNPRNRVVIQMDDGWVFYRKDSYPEGTPAEDICYYRYGVFAPRTDWSFLVIVDESTLDPDQIYGLPNPGQPVVTE